MDTPEPIAAEPTQKPAISEAQLAANRANAQHSTGPATETGRAKSSQNALKHGLTSKTVVLAGESAAEYNRLLASYIETYAPANEEERRLTQSLLDSTWRIARLKRIESAIFLKGEIEFANRFEDRMVFEREDMIHAEVYLKYEKSIRNLNIQEARLRRAMEKDLAELQRLQTTRRRTERIAAEEAAKTPTAPKPNGFDFATQPTRPQTTASAAGSKTRHSEGLC